ncbi:MAG TPA: hypothetical protein VFY71_10505 [Planctomycetota bacterium]|nr:hypothetical protein [Planctomycetota bacterium]
MLCRTFALLLALAAPAAAQDFIYALNLHGKLSINGTVLDSMPSSFDSSTGEGEFETWTALAVAGPDRFALRRDGKLFKNGKKLYQFNMATDGFNIFTWHGLAASVNAVHALRQEGLLNSNGVDVVTYPRDVFFFSKLAVNTDAAADTVFALRSDGSVFSGTTTTAKAKFVASQPGGDPADGTFATTIWIDIAVDTLNGDLFVLRADGELWKVPLADIAAADGTGPPGGTQVAALPFPPLGSPPVIPSLALFYTSLAVANGNWRVLRADGSVFTAGSVLTPLVDYAGDGLGDQDFLAVAAKGDDTFAVRDDGLLFKNVEGTDPLLSLPGSDFLALAIGSEPPDLSSFKNPVPKASPYTAIAVEGQPLSIPVIVSDIEKLPSDLIVTVNPDVPLPTGVVFQELDDGFGNLIRTLEYDGSLAIGKYPCKLIVDDGSTKPKKFTTTLKVVAADVDPLKNKPPKPFKVKPVQALVGFETRIPILATDFDGDPLTITVNTDKYPFNEAGGASFDAKTNEFVWTPTFDNIGTAHPKFHVSDGIKTKTLSITVKVKNPLIFEPPPGP